jgi:hypothetical protein
LKVKIIALCIIITVLYGCHPVENRKIPGELLGEWITSEPRYAGCVLEFTDGAIIFGNGPDHLSINYIVNIKKVTYGKTTVYTIYYEDSRGLKYTFPVLFGFVNKKGVLRFKNQNHVVWTKRKGLL